MPNAEREILVLDVSEDENDENQTQTMSNIQENSFNDIETDSYDPDMSPAVMGYLLAQIFRNYQKVITEYEDSSNVNLIIQLKNVLITLNNSKNEYAKLLTMLSDREQLDIQKEIERHEQAFMKKHKEILEEKDLEHRLHETVAVGAAKINCIKEIMECVICYQEEKDTVIMPCSHTFCHNCVTKMFEHGRKCAVCRGRINNSTKVRFTT
jgi:hypothetical protein